MYVQTLVNHTRQKGRQWRLQAFQPKAKKTRIYEMSLYCFWSRSCRWLVRLCILTERLFLYGGWFVPCRIIVFSGRKGEKAPREHPPNGDFFVFSHGDLSPRHTKVRHFSCVAFSPPDCRIFAWRGERSPCENKITFWRFFAWRPFALTPRKHVYTTWHKSATIVSY